MSLIEATDADFNTLIAKHDKVVVKYFADWCGTCRLFAPKYQRLSGDVRFEGITFLDVNAEESPEARKLACVDSLPFFATFKNGAKVEGKATAREETIVDMINALLK